MSEATGLRNSAAEAATVTEAKEAGLSWEEIAEALGRTRSGVWKKILQPDRRRLARSGLRS